MFKYLTLSNNKNKLYYYKNHKGIYESTVLCDRLSDSRIICENVKKSFFVYKGTDDITHLIAISYGNELLYMALKNNEWQKYTISKLNPKIDIKKIMIGVSKSIQNLFYSARYEDEFILVHCVLGNNAMPETIDKLYDENFFISGDCVYYSNQQKELCCRNFSDSKPDRFTKISMGTMPYFTKILGNSYLVSKCDDNILINNEIAISDLYSEFPILQYEADFPTLIWRCGDFLKYIPIKKEPPQKPLRYIGIKKSPDIFVLSTGFFTQYFYGTVFNNTVRFFPKLDLSEKVNSSSEHNTFFKKTEEIQKLNKMISDLKKEIGIYTTEINKLRSLINNMNTDF